MLVHIVKRCSGICGRDLTLDKFYPDPRREGIAEVGSVCKECRALARAEPAAKAKQKEIDETRKGTRNEYFEQYNNKRDRTLTPEQKERANELQRERRKDPVKRFSSNVRSRISHALGRHSMGTTRHELIGCSYKELCEHIEQQFDEFMTWDNYGKYWEHDHIIPVDAFDLSDTEQQKLCFHYTNIRPLEIPKNRKKSNKRVY